MSSTDENADHRRHSKRLCLRVVERPLAPTGDAAKESITAYQGEADKGRQFHSWLVGIREGGKGVHKNIR